MGATIVHAQSRHILSLAAALNLSRVSVAGDAAGAVRVWDGSSFVLSLVRDDARCHT